MGLAATYIDDVETKGEQGQVPTYNHENNKQVLNWMIYTGTGPIIRNRLLHIGFSIFRVFRIYPQAFSFRPSLADAD